MDHYGDSLKPDYLLSTCTIPYMLDVPLEHHPAVWHQSGIGYGEDLRLQRVVHYTAAHHYPLITPGFYFHLLQPHYLPGDRTVHLFWLTDTTTLDLPWPPRPGEPLWMSTYRWGRNRRILVDRRWRPRLMFSGLLDHGRELVDLNPDGTVRNYNLAYADPAQDEVVVVRRPDYLIRRPLRLPANASPGLQSLTLNPAAHGDWQHFTHAQYFSKRVTGTPSSPGEWRLINNGATLQVYLPMVNVDLGHIIYCQAAPVTLITAVSPRLAHGRVTEPLDPGTMYYLGLSDGTPHQMLLLPHFPVATTPVPQVAVRANGTTTPWTYVPDLATADGDDPVFTVDSFYGLLRFGDGVHGAVPPAGGEIYAAWTSMPYIHYPVAPEEHHGLDLNLHPLYRGSRYGFLFLNHRQTHLQLLTLQTNAPLLRTGIHGPLYCGTDHALLTVQAFDGEGYGLPGLAVQLQCTGRAQFGLQPFMTDWHGTTDTHGRCTVALYAPNNIMRVATPVELFDEHNDPLNPYRTTDLPNDTLVIDWTDADLLLVPELTYVFLCLDDDPFYPYDPRSRQGGRLVLLYTYDDDADNFVPVQPAAATADRVRFPLSLPTPATTPSLRRFLIAAPRLAQISCQARDPLTSRLMTSNSLTFALQAPIWQTGPWTLRSFRTQAGAAIGTATYLTLDRRGRLDCLLTLS